MSRIYKHPKSGVWHADLRDIGGGRPSLKTRSKRVAERAFHQLQLASCEPRLDPLLLPQVLTLALEAKKRNALAKKRNPKGTLKTGKTHAGHLQRILGADIDFTDPETNLERIGDAYLAQRLQESTPWGTPITPHTIKKELGTLRQGLYKAKRYKLYSDDPKLVVPDALQNVYTPHDRWLPEDEFVPVRSEAPHDKRKHLDLGVETGADHGELEKVHKKHDVDLSTTRGPDGAIHVPGTKTDDRDRWIPLSKVARAAVDECLAEPGEYLVPIWHNFKRDMVGPCKRAGVKPFIWKDLRRTFCSRLCQAGVPEFHTIKLMGHKSSAMVRKVYAQLSPATYEAAITRLNAAPYVRHDNVVDISKGREMAGDPQGRSGAKTTY